MVADNGPRRQIIRQIIRRLRRDKRGFGTRLCSYYSQDEPQFFISCVVDLPSVRILFPNNLTGRVGVDLTLDQQKKLKEIVDRVDWYGELVEGWRHGGDVSQNCLDDLKERLKFWVSRNMPDYCWGEVALSRVVCDLMDIVQANIDGYTYEVDLLVWAIPFLVRALRSSLRRIILQSRPSVDLTRLRRQLKPKAQEILIHIRNTYGIYCIKVDDVIERALLFVMRADDEEYNAHQHDVSEWALSKLKDQIKLQILFYCEPNMSHDWGHNPNKDQWEMQKRRKLLEAFYDLVSD